MRGSDDVPPRRSRPASPAPKAPGRLRVIAGTLRGSKLAVPDVPGLRPTPDRVRETLFNWLMPVVAGARCIDLFAGTGALGIEALSRGAAWVDFVERDAQLARGLRETLARLRQTRVIVHDGDALDWLAQVPARPYDIAFLDPPFPANLWSEAALRLENGGWLGPAAFVYVELPSGAQAELPANWRLHRDATAGAVRHALYRRSGPSAKL